MTLVVPDDVTVDLASMTLDQLAERANAEHASSVDEVDSARAHLTAGVIHGIQAGEALLVVRLKFGERGSGWKKWCEENLGFHYRTATEYIRMARRKKEILATDQHLNGGTVSAFMDSLPPLPRLTRTPNEKREQALDLLAAGLTQIEVAAELGVHRETIRVWSQPDYAERTRRKNYEHARKRRRREKEARQALAEKEARAERDRLAKSTGGDLSAMYADVRKALARKVLDDAKPNQTDDIKTAIAALHKAEDAIVAAMRSGRVA